MGPKKQKQEEWNECLKCNRVVHKKDVAQHKDDCSAIHGYVLDSVLHALTASPTAQTRGGASLFPSIVLVPIEKAYVKFLPAFGD